MRKKRSENRDAREVETERYRLREWRERMS